MSLSRSRAPTTFRAESLTEIISRDEVDPHTLYSHTGMLRASYPSRNKAPKQLMPSGPEQLRLRLTDLLFCRTRKL